MFAIFTWATTYFSETSQYMAQSTDKMSHCHPYDPAQDHVHIAQDKENSPTRVRFLR